MQLKTRNMQLERELSTIEDAEARREGQTVVLTLPESILFDLGDADLRSGARETLIKLGDILKNHRDRFVLVEGHADTIPIGRSMRFSSNWDLSAIRASNVVEFLVNRTDVNPDRIIAAGYGDRHPIVPNNSPSNRQNNRRVEVVLYPPDLPRKQLDFSAKSGENRQK